MRQHKQLTSTQRILFELWACSHKKRRVRVKYINRLFHYIDENNGGASILEFLGNAFAWIFAPLGFGSWQAAVATILGDNTW